MPPGDSAALAARLVELLRDPSRREAMGAAARERHDALFTVERMVARTAGVYRALLGRV